MAEYSTDGAEMPVLLMHLWALLEASREAWGQERNFRRAVALLHGELFTFGRHTVTQVLRALGETRHDWTAWYRLFSRGRFKEEEAGRVLVRETAKEVAAEDPYVMTVDGVRTERSGRKIAGSGWWEATNTAPFRRGLCRAQRFVEVAWLTPVAGGYSRAIPLRWLPAPTGRSVGSAAAVCKEWEAGLQGMHWVRGELDRAGASERRMLVLADGNYDVQDIWQQLPGRCALLVRCAKNRALYALPPKEGKGRGRPPSYGARQPAPAAYLRWRKGWQEVELTIRGHQRRLVYRCAGPFVVEGASAQPLFLLVVRGQSYWRGRRQKYRQPAYYLVSAVEREGRWCLPWPAEVLLLWSWQRWECEVAHREMKSALGVGEKQCWGPLSAHRAVQWGVWVYALCVLAAYRTWGLLGGPLRQGAWYRRAHRWSFSSMWQGYRQAFWQLGEFRPLYAPTLNKWFKKETWQSGLSNALADAGRI